MQNIDIASLVKDALIQIGCKPDVVGSIDGHSAIMFDFNGTSPMYLATQESGVWLWAPLGLFDERMLSHCGGEMLAHLMRPRAFLHSGHAAVSVENGDLEYKGMVHPDFLNDGSNFAIVLQEFYEDMLAFSEIIHR